MYSVRRGPGSPSTGPSSSRKILEYYTALFKLDTSNPPGNETLAVNYLKPILDRAGIPNQVFSLDPKRGNLVARLNGNGTQGTHDELMAKGGQYSELYGIQAAAYR